MAASRPQVDVSEYTHKSSQQDEIRQDVDLQSPRAPDSDIANTHQITDPDALPTNGQNNGTITRRIQDHPQWSASLADRHILESAITAGVWVEREESTGQDVLVSREKRRDGSPGATRRRLLTPVRANGKKQAKVRWQYAGQKTDEPFHYIGTLDESKGAIAADGGNLYIVEGAFDVLSLHTMGIRNVIGIYGISNIPKDIAAIFDELAVTKFTYYADNDASGERGASNSRTLLHRSGWRGEQDYRKFAGPGIPEKGDANDLLCHYFPDISAARAALDALPKFSPRIQRRPVQRLSSEINHDQPGWDAVKEAIRLALGIDRFKANGYSKNIRCLNPLHEDKTPSAAWHKDGYCTCHGCGDTYNAKQVAEWLGIDWRALIRPQRSIVATNNIDLGAAPQIDSTEAPLSFDQPPDSWLRLLIKFFPHTVAVLFHFAFRLCRTGPLTLGFTIQEFVKSLRPLGCNISERSIYRVFEDVLKHDNHLLFAKLDPSEGSSVWNCKFRLRSLKDIERRMMHAIYCRVHESTFHKHRDTLIAFNVFAEALLGSSLAKALESALEPLYTKQKKRFESLLYVCEQKIAAYQADLEDLHATSLPDWTIDKPSEFPALLARGIYDADPEDRSMREWARLLGISKASVAATLTRAAIKRTAYTEKHEVNSQREAKDKARELGAKIVAVEADGAHELYDAAMEINQGSIVVLQPTALHEIVSDEKQIIKAAAAKPSITAPAETPSKRADNMKKPGNWHKPSWDPQFLYWEMVKACCLLHGYEVIDDIGLSDPQTGEVWTNPTLASLVRLITGEPGDAEPDTG